MSNDETRLEAEIQAKGQNAPRLTPDRSPLPEPPTARTRSRRSPANAHD